MLGEETCGVGAISHGVHSCNPCISHFVVEANSLVSSETEIPVRYYRMPFCKPEEGVKRASSTVNPGTILLGIRILNSPYVFSVMVRDRRHSYRCIVRMGWGWKLTISTVTGENHC